MSIQGAMKQTRHWMWTRSKLMSSGRSSWFPSFPPTSSSPSSASFSSYSDSWEEQAFAKDTVGCLGEYVWPPRSYSCSFCRREFRSAQALGGHMNVHRRDRARLKASSPPPLQIAHGDTSLLHRQHPSYQPVQVCGLVSSSNPNHEAVASPPVVPSTKENYSDESALDCPSFIASSVAQEQQRKRRAEPLSDLKLGRDDLRPIEGGYGQQPKRSGEEEEEEITNSGNKRQRTDGALPFLILTSGDGDYCRGSRVHGNCHEPIHEELDLELRLGDRPKVK